MYKHILLPTDGSELSGRAIKAGVALAKSLDARVIGLYAAPDFHAGLDRNAPPSPAEQAEYEALARKHAERYLPVIESAARLLGVPYEGVFVREDKPYDAIIRTAIEKGCDLVFMAPHGNQSVLGLKLGSNTEKVLTNSKVPVLVHR